MSTVRPDEPCVLVYNPIAGHGHLDSWNDMLIGLLLESGWRVLALTPDADKLQGRLAARQLPGQDRLHILPWRQIRPGLTERVVGRLRRIASRWLRLAASPAEMDTEANFLEPVEFARRVGAAVSEAGRPVDVVFNLYMDLYRTDPVQWAKFESTFRGRWAGIRFVPRFSPSEAYYQMASCMGMCFLDENVCAHYREKLPAKTFECLPDITDASLPKEPTALVREIVRRADGRKVVFLGGTIGGNKNLARWFEFISIADPQRWFFLQIGEINANALTQEDRIALARAEAAPPENLLIHREYLPDERAFNDVIRMSDLIFAVYRDFRISSNMPGKAAAFEKPILVSTGFLMDHRVTRYGIGKAVPQDDAHAMLAAAEELMARPVPVEHFSAYRAEFSLANMRKALTRFLENHSGQRSV